MANRPRAMAELEAILAARAQEYARCEITVETSHKSIEQIAREVSQRLGAGPAARVQPSDGS